MKSHYACEINEINLLNLCKKVFLLFSIKFSIFKESWLNIWYILSLFRNWRLCFLKTFIGIVNHWPKHILYKAWMLVIIFYIKMYTIIMTWMIRWMKKLFFFHYPRCSISILHWLLLYATLCMCFIKMWKKFLQNHVITSWPIRFSDLNEKFIWCNYLGMKWERINVHTIWSLRFARWLEFSRVQFTIIGCVWYAWM